MSKINNILPENIDLDTRILRYIIAIVDENGLSKAAEKLYLPQPVLSRYLRNVEQTLGTPIFIREHNKLTLTDAGKIFINGARNIVHIEQEAAKELRNIRQHGDTNLMVASSSLFASLLEEYVHPALQNLHPEICPQIIVAGGDQIREMVSHGNVDIGFFAGAVTDNPFFEQEVLFTSELVFFSAAGSAGQAASLEKGFHISHFAEEPMMLSSNDSFLREHQERILHENGIQEPDIWVQGRLSALTELLHHGYGNVILPLEAMDIEPDRIFSFSPPRQYSCIAAWHPGRAPYSPVQDYVALAKSALKDFVHS